MVIKGNTKDALGPYRVLPGRLSVCRTFGDAEAKIGVGGNPNVITAIPDIKYFKIDDECDFIIMGSDGVFDKLSSIETVQCIWNSVKEKNMRNIHKQCGLAVESVLKNALGNKSLDNVTSLFIAFSNFKNYLKEANPRIYRSEDKENYNKNGINIKKAGVTKGMKKVYSVGPEVILKVVDRNHFNFREALSKIKLKSLSYI